MHLLPLTFLLLSAIVPKASARPSLNTTAANDDYDVTCFLPRGGFPAVSEEVCEPLLQHLESFTDALTFEGIDFPQTYTVRGAPRCLVIIEASRQAKDFFPGSEFGTAARRVLTECESRVSERAFSYGGFASFRPSRSWYAEVKGRDSSEMERGAGTNQTLIMHPPDVAVD